MSTTTSIGTDASRGSNDNPGNADGCGNKTLGSDASQRPPSGAGIAEQGTPAMPAGVAGAQPRPDVATGPDAAPDGPNVGPSAVELDAARGKLPEDR